MSGLLLNGGLKALCFTELADITITEGRSTRAANTMMDFKEGMDSMKKYVIKVNVLGWVRLGDSHGATLILPGGLAFCDSPYKASTFTEDAAGLVSKAIEESGDPLMKNPIVVTFEEAVALHATQKAAERFDPKAVEEADQLAQRGDGYTEDEWQQMPDSYMGQCEKMCYAPTRMVKGEVWEYGARGVYVCSQCGYAYPPLLWPNPKGKDRTNYLARMQRISEGPSKRSDQRL